MQIIPTYEWNSARNYTLTNSIFFLFLETEYVCNTAFKLIFSDSYIAPWKSVKNHLEKINTEAYVRVTTKDVRYHRKDSQ